MRLGDPSVLVDDVGDPFRILILRRIGSTVRDPDLAIGVAQQGEREIKLLGESRVRIRIIETRTEDGRVLLFILADEVPEPGTLGRSARCVGLRIEPKHDFAAAQIVERNVTPKVIVHFKIRSLIANV
jgi:hypothetical protein